MRNYGTKTKLKEPCLIDGKHEEKKDEKNNKEKKKNQP